LLFSFRLPIQLIADAVRCFLTQQLEVQGGTMKFLTALCIASLPAGWIGCVLPVQAATSDEIVKRLDLLERENATLRERVRRLEGQRQPSDRTKVVSRPEPTRAYAATETNAAAFAPPSYSWTGVYVGGHVGWGWQTSSVHDPFSVCCTPVFTPGIPVRDVNGDGFLGGLQAGWRYQLGNLIIGNAVSASTTQLSGNRTDALGATGLSNPGSPFTTILSSTDQRRWSLKTDWLATATLQVGYAWGRWLAYSAGGIAAARNKYTFFDASSSVQSGFFSQTFTSTTAQTSADTRVGWIVGAGLERAVLENWSAFVEYNYINFGDKPVMLGGVQTTVSIPGTSSATNLASVYHIDQKYIQLVKLGLNYRFSSNSDVLSVKY
jgi:outer membrane immunogenic protein